jgi:hypothetical protein
MNRLPTPGRGGAVPGLLRAVAVAGLAVDVLVHLRLAGAFDAIGTQITLGHLFRVESAAAAAAAAYLALRDSRRAWLLAGLVAAAGLAALLLSAAVEVPAIGPFPPLAAPGWTTDSIAVTIAMAVTVAAWLVREALRRRGG